MQVAGVGPVRFVSCELRQGAHWEDGHNYVSWETMHRVTEGLPELARCQQCLRVVAFGVSGGEVQVLDT